MYTEIKSIKLYSINMIFSVDETITGDCRNMSIYLPNDSKVLYIRIII